LILSGCGEAPNVISLEEACKTLDKSRTVSIQPVEEAYKDWCGEYPSGSPSEDARWDAFLNGYWATQPKAIPVDEPYRDVKAYWDEKDNPKPMDEVVDRLIKESSYEVHGVQSKGARFVFAPLETLFKKPVFYK